MNYGNHSGGKTGRKTGSKTKATKTHDIDYKVKQERYKIQILTI